MRQPDANKAPDPDHVDRCRCVTGRISAGGMT